MVGVETVADPSDSRVAQVRDLVRSADGYRVAMWAIVGVQAIWLGALMSRGWYYQDDLAFLAQATGRSLGVSYLTSPINDHLAPGVRLSFWIMRHTATLNYLLTIAVRVALQAAATVLLWRLLTTLVGRRMLVPVIVGLYALSPLLLGILWLSSAVNLLPAQVLVLAAYLSHSRFVRTGRLAIAIETGFALVGAALFWEKSAVNALLLVPLSLGYLYDGSVRERLIAARRQWVGWLITALPLAAFVVAFVAGGYGGSARGVGALELIRTWWHQWADTVAPAAAGGPWRWLAPGSVYVGLADAPTVGIWLAEALALLGVITGLVVNGRHSLVAWSLPAISIVVGSTLVAIGRFSEFGLLTTRTLSYAFDVAIPLALALALTLSPAMAPARVAQSEMRSVQPVQPTATRDRVLRRVAPAVMLAVVLVGSIFSAVRFAQRWQQNPTHAYVKTLRADLASRDQPNLFDTSVPESVVSYIEPTRYLSDLIPLIGARVVFDGSSSDPQLVDYRGHIVPATFLPVAQVKTFGNNSFCNDLISGLTDTFEAMTPPPQPNEWFLQIAYFQQHAGVLYLTLIDRDGREVSPVSGPRMVLNSQLGTNYLRFPSVAPVALRIRSTSPATNICLTQAQVGYPFPAKGQS